MRIASCFVVLLAAVLLSACSNPGIVKLSPETYMVSKTGVNAGSVKAELVREATAFAEKQGKVAVPLATNSTPTGFGYSVDYQFRVVDKNDPEARRTALYPRADVVVEKTEKITADVNSKDSKAPDLYTELTKLDELRKKGIITDAEFEVQKKRLLERQ